jgi:hypothetical protein
MAMKLNERIVKVFVPLRQRDRACGEHRSRVSYTAEDLDPTSELVVEYIYFGVLICSQKIKRREKERFKELLSEAVNGEPGPPLPA